MGWMIEESELRIARVFINIIENISQEMGIDEQFEKQLIEYQSKIKNGKPLTIVIQTLLTSPHCESWKIMDLIIADLDSLASRDVSRLIERNIRDIRSFMMLLYIYSLKFTNRNIDYGFVYWKSRYQDVGIDNGDIIIFKTWVSSQPSSQLVQQSLNLIARYFPSMIAKEKMELTEVELGAVIEWVTYLETPDADKYSAACELVKMAKETRLVVHEDFLQKQHLILKKLIEVSGQSSSSSPNIFLFIYPFTLQERDINYFCNIYCDFLTDLAEDNICNFFLALTKSAISKEIVLLIKKISELLKNEDEYFKLRVIYQRFILPILVSRAKGCIKVEDYVYESCRFYILGFLKHCDIGREGINCILKGIEKIKNSEMRRKWIELCEIIAFRYPESKSLICDYLKKQVKETIELNSSKFKEIVSDPQIVWEVTLRSGRKHKKYLKVRSKMRGIENSHNDCYIISTVQGLQKIIYLQELLDSYRDNLKAKLPLLDELRVLFSEVDGRRKAERVKVSYLKKKGPHEFADSLHQEDAHQYIIQLFDAMEKEMKKVPGMLDKFKSIFEIREINEQICKKCKNMTQKEEFAYTYTLPHTEILNDQTEDTIADYVCEKCGAKDMLIKRKLLPDSRVLIVHINRFSHENGLTKKELSTQTILRCFGAYKLVGMICHIGKNVEHGHYIYYGKVNEKRWAQFNDQVVEEFDLGSEEEEFEREMKSEMTPYILFYRRYD